ncbi:hypothetical protein [Phenylobacterium sp.]|uniref:hypothetical protein n=1 Tax=Phenylobacterium sp. TaxID=1871053 RepID=UPI0037C6337A
MIEWILSANLEGSFQFQLIMRQTGRSIHGDRGRSAGSNEYAGSKTVKERTVRSLVALEESASTARVLNLAATLRNAMDDPSLKARPFFENRILNASIIVKHRIRPHELELFSKPRATATKIMAPIDGADLKLGARFVMVGQRDFDETAEEMFGEGLRSGRRDRQVLELIDEIPSLDPFLLRENLKRNGFEPARGYFAISDADVERMYAFVRAQVTALVNLSSEKAGDSSQAASRLVDKLLSNSPDEGFGPLKDGLRLNDKDYADGVFGWRGFLYYKWVLDELTPQLGTVLEEVATIRPRGLSSPDSSNYLPKARRRLEAAISQAVYGVNRMLAVYDNAYASLTQDGQPTAFRDFLLAAPDMFMSLGEQSGAVQHILSFWRYRFPLGRRVTVSPDELMDIFLDFEDGLLCVNPDETSNQAA